MSNHYTEINRENNLDNIYQDLLEQRKKLNRENGWPAMIDKVWNDGEE